MTLMPASVAAISIVSFFVGQVLVTRRSCYGFLIWAASNLLVACVSLCSGDVATAGMFATYTLANAWSLLSWSTKPESFQATTTRRVSPPRGDRTSGAADHHKILISPSPNNPRPPHELILAPPTQKPRIANLANRTLGGF